MQFSQISLAVASCAVVLAIISPARGADTVATDPSGDGEELGLDITSIKLSNRDNAVVTRVQFVQAAKGDLIVFYRARGDRRSDVTRIVSAHRGARDVNTLETREGEATCRGLTAKWDPEAATAKIRLPSKCFQGGDYGAVRVRVLTEVRWDVDYAPKGPVETEDAEPRWRWTRWVARG